MISAVVLTKNEEKNIEACLASLSWCDEIVVIDDHSHDNTVTLAKKHGAKVFSHDMKGDFSRQRNYGLEKATGEWVLFIDADERVSSALWYEIMEYTNNPLVSYAGFFIKRTDIMWRKELLHGETGGTKLLRLAKKDAGIWEGPVHETWKVHGKTFLLEKPLLHYPHPTIAEFLQEINFYTDLRAKQLYKKKTKVYWWSIIVYPKAKFVLNYIFRGGCLDGLAGLVFALMMSFHSFLVRSKLWLLWQKKK